VFSQLIIQIQDGKRVQNTLFVIVVNFPCHLLVFLVEQFIVFESPTYKLVCVFNCNYYYASTIYVL